MKFNKLFSNYLLNIIVSIFLFTYLAGCNQQVNQNVERGSTYKYQEGFPEVRVSAIGLFDAENKPGINITADIVYGSLIYSSSNDEDGGLEASLKAGIQIKNRKNDKTVKREGYSFDVTAKNRTITNSQRVFTFQKRIPISPGSYDVLVTIVDQSSGKKTTRKTEAFIPEYDDNKPRITTIQLLSKDSDVANSAFTPVTTYDVQKKNDSLAFRFQVTNAADDTVEITNTLMSFKYDSTIARSMSSPDYSQGSIQYEGIEYDERTILQENKRLIIQPRNVVVALKVPILEKGNYRFRATITSRSGSSNNSGNSNDGMQKSRDFSVKSANYPTPKTPRELAGPLAYLMGEKEHNKLMSIESSDSLKKAIDKFWLDKIKKPQVAKDVIAKYYERVEQANKQFSNFKAGWKTDMGMIYVLFGPPYYVDDFNVDQMQWSYSYNREEFESNYFFFQPTLENKYFPFQHYILERDQDYFNIVFRQRENWKTGDILTQPLPY